MEHLVDVGLVKSLAVSNVNSAQLERLINLCRIKPVSLLMNRKQFFIVFFCCTTFVDDRFKIIFLYT